MGVKTTSKGTKKFTKAEKIAILKEASEKGVKVTLSKYELYPATFYYWKRKFVVHGEEGINHRSQKELVAENRRLEKENKKLKVLLGEKELEGALKDEALKKKVSRDEAKTLVRDYMSMGLKRDTCLKIVGLTRNQFYYTQKVTKPGKQKSTFTIRRDPETLEVHEIDNAEVVKEIVKIKENPDRSHWYKLVTIALKIKGYYINHKRVYRLMFDYLLLEDKRNRTGRKFVKYRRVTPSGPLRVIEMDIKYFWIHEKCRYAFVLTILDTFTRYVYISVMLCQ